jgi:L-lactate dehydrogenase (cytochrome)
MDYIEGSAEDELTASWNRKAFSGYSFLPRTLRDVSKVNLSTTVQGITIDMPVIAAPTGMTRMFHHEGELAVARASHKAGTAYTLSSVATTIEEVAMAAKGPLFFQVYVWHNRKMIRDFVERCRKMNYDGLCWQSISPQLANVNEICIWAWPCSEIKWNMARSAIIKPCLALSLSYTTEMADGEYVGASPPHGALADKVLDNVNQQFDASVTWEDAVALMKTWVENLF